MSWGNWCGARALGQLVRCKSAHTHAHAHTSGRYNELGQLVRRKSALSSATADLGAAGGGSGGGGGAMSVETPNSVQV